MDYIAITSAELSSGELAGDNGGAPFFEMQGVTAMLHRANYGSNSQLYQCEESIVVFISGHMQLDFATRLREIFNGTNPNDQITKVIFPDFSIIDFNIL